jgi:glycosyltransferase involved in cell wall biosynthesis
MNMPTLIVFCHLRWDFVFQRPQHLMTRLAEHYDVLFVEEPVYSEGQPYLKKTAVAPNITVCQPHTAIHAPGFHDDQIPTLQTLLADLAPEGEQPVVWFYTPMALPLLQGLNPSLVVYDCMDELAAFKNPPKQLVQRESALLNIADLVFTGGPSLYESKRKRHANAHCFSSSVDAKHFRQAQDRSFSHPDQEHIPHPRLGFYGVIDERFDIEMVREMAAARPDWQIVLVGPVVKIDPAHLPTASNIHYMGQRTYEELPKFLAGWDVCLLPFALNESTKFISPTKVLEYMAAELPSVSTPITDVKVPYGDVVAIADGPAEFIAACDRMLALDDAGRAELAARMRAIVAKTSWDNTASRMHHLIQTTVPGNKAERLASAAVDEADVIDAGNVDTLPVAAAQKAHWKNVAVSGASAAAAVALQN